jgi:hypothetical protein
MQDLVEFIQDLRELQKLYVMGDICFLDFEEKIARYESEVDRFEDEMDKEMEAFHGS